MNINWQSFFGVVVPYAAVIIFIIGFLYRINKWGRSPVPFHIPTVAGQQKSLLWIKDDKIESPSSTAGVTVRMLLEVLIFRSLFRNDRVELKRSQKLVYGGNRWLWLAGLAFHWSLLFILFRHLRLLTEPVPSAVVFFQNIDGIFQVAVPTLFITDVIILIALSFLVLRRLASPQIRYISLPADYFASILILAITVTGVLMRMVFRVDLESVKELAMSMLILRPVVPEGLGPIFFVHIFLVSTLVAYFSYSKLMHGAGLLLSPTRNLLNNSRWQRHLNPWSYPVKTHTYEEYEDEFREAMKKVGLPVERE